MKKFQFSLETVMTYKQQLQDVVKAEHAEALVQLHRQQDVLEQIWQEYRSYNEEFCQRKLSGLAITEAILYENGLRVLENNIKRETETLEQLQRQEEEKREKVVESKKETATLENLRGKKLDSYNKALQKDEEAFIEEFVATARSRSHSA